MEIQCTECGTSHEVGESHKDAQMFCLECDNFFKIDKNFKASKKENYFNTAFEENIESIDEEKVGINKKIITAFKNLFAIKKKNDNIELAPEPQFDSDPPKMTERFIGTETRSLASIDDFLDPEADFENQPEDVPSEYIDFLSVGLDISSSDLIENHGKNKTEDIAPQKEQE